MHVRSKSHAGVKINGQKGVGLIELILAAAVLAVGLLALLQLTLAVTYTSNKNSKDTSGTLIAQTVLEQISSQSPNSAQPDTVTDCTGTTNTVATAGDIPANGGAGATLDSNTSSPTYGLIDWSQAFSNVPANYAMKYTDCAANGHATVYEVRWNVITVSPNATRLITVSARQVSPFSNKSGGGGLAFAIPVTLRGVGGP
jgi:Tfp pilus assembly protein PilV